MGVSLRVLVIEDDLDTAQNMAFLMRDMGHEVDFAINAPAALETARRRRPSVVFLGVGLQDFEGSSLAIRLRQQPGMEKARILALEKPLDPAALEGMLKP